MSNHVFKVWCEWDIGMDDVVFPSREAAWEYVDQIWDYDNVQMTVKECKDECLIGLEPLEVIGE